MLAGVDRVGKTSFHLLRRQPSSQPQNSLKLGDLACVSGIRRWVCPRALILESGPTLSVTLTAPRPGGTLILVQRGILGVKSGETMHSMCRPMMVGMPSQASLACVVSGTRCPRICHPREV